MKDWPSVLRLVQVMVLVLVLVWERQMVQLKDQAKGPGWVQVRDLGLGQVKGLEMDRVKDRETDLSLDLETVQGTDQGLDQGMVLVTGLDWDQATVRESVRVMVRESVRD